ncbi:hypothetical protein AB5N19_13436 [Seiridium cardinale]|uniref:Uncharacterized protein n=1 Tax=Seiridium cardinale TaxID=138064 RepID=A0ABR2X5E9_9PEZI
MVADEVILPDDVEELVSVALEVDTVSVVLLADSDELVMPEEVSSVDVVPVARVEELPYGVEIVDVVTVVDSVTVKVVTEPVEEVVSGDDEDEVQVVAKLVELLVNEIDSVTVIVEVLPMTVLIVEMDSLLDEPVSLIKVEDEVGSGETVYVVIVTDVMGEVLELLLLSEVDEEELLSVWDAVLVGSVDELPHSDVEVETVTVIVEVDPIFVLEVESVTSLELDWAGNELESVLLMVDPVLEVDMGTLLDSDCVMVTVFVLLAVESEALLELDGAVVERLAVLLEYVERELELPVSKEELVKILLDVGKLKVVVVIVTLVPVVTRVLVDPIMLVEFQE